MCAGPYQLLPGCRPTATSQRHHRRRARDGSWLPRSRCYWACRCCTLAPHQGARHRTQTLADPPETFIGAKNQRKLFLYKVFQELLPALLQKLVGEFFLIFRREIFGKFSGKFGGNFAGFFLTHRTEAQKFRGKLRSIFRNKIRSSKKIFRAKFTLQTCHLNKNPSGHGRPRRKSWTSAQKSVVFCGPGDGEKLFDPGSSGRKGQECPREIRTEKFMFMLFFFPDSRDFKNTIRTEIRRRRNDNNSRRQ